MAKINITGKGAEGNRIRIFGIYALCVIVFFIFSNFMIDIIIKSTYNPIDIYENELIGIKLDINEAQATYVNGYIGGMIKSDEEMSKSFLKIDLYSKRDVCLVTKYVILDNVSQGEVRKFRMGFKFTDVEYAQISRVDEITNETNDEEFKSDNLNGAILIATVILLCFLG